MLITCVKFHPVKWSLSDIGTLNEGVSSFSGDKDNPFHMKKAFYALWAYFQLDRNSFNYVFYGP